MPYTLWSRGQLVGHSDLGFREFLPTLRCGWFHPAELGEQIIEVMTTPNRMMLHADQRRDTETFLADLECISQRIEALDLHLRAPDGSDVATEDISIRDTELTLQFAALAAAEHALDESSIDEMLARDIEADVAMFEREMPDDDNAFIEPEEDVPFPRYQIMVYLLGHDEAMLQGTDAA